MVPNSYYYYPRHWGEHIRAHCPIYCASSFLYSLLGMLMMCPDTTACGVSWMQYLGLGFIIVGCTSFAADVWFLGRGASCLALGWLDRQLARALMVAAVALVVLGTWKYRALSAATLGAAIVCKTRASKAHRMNDMHGFVRWHTWWHVLSPLAGAMLPLGCVQWGPTILGCMLQSTMIIAVTLTLLMLSRGLLARFLGRCITPLNSDPLSLLLRWVQGLVPAYSYSRSHFFRADGAPEHVAQAREKAFEGMSRRWRERSPKAIEIGDWSQHNVSDSRFASQNRVFPPFRKVLGEAFQPCPVVEQAEGPELLDVDGHRLLDISGSYGVNVCGYDQYKSMLRAGVERMLPLGCVLGPVHPLLRDNVEKLKQLVPGFEEVSFHMSGTEAVMCAVRLARFNTRRKLLVQFSGAYHGWWDGVQTGPGNERWATDVLTLRDMSSMSLQVLRLRASEIAAVIVNPLQSFHPNAPPPSDVALASNNRTAGSRKAEYSEWLNKLRTVCTEAGIVLIMDEVYTGFRLSVGGAQEYFGVRGDMVCFGKTLGGGLPLGVVMGPRRLMQRSDPSAPLRVAYVIGTFAAHPLVLGTMAEFLKWATQPETPALYADAEAAAATWAQDLNTRLAQLGAPVQVQCQGTIWTILYTQPGRYHWMFQYYLRDQGVNMSWVGTGRLNFSFDWFREQSTHLERLADSMVTAAKLCLNDGWWHPANPTALSSVRLGKEMLLAALTGRAP